MNAGDLNPRIKPPRKGSLQKQAPGAAAPLLPVGPVFRMFV